MYLRSQHIAVISVNIGFVYSIVAKRRECSIYNMTSQAEEEEEDDDEMPIRSKRDRKTKGIPEGFVRNGMHIVIH